MKIKAILTPNLKPLLVAAGVLAALGASTPIFANTDEKPVAREYVRAPDAPVTQTWDAANAKSTGCISCHTDKNIR